jgi:hypothetical protein
MIKFLKNYGYAMWVGFGLGMLGYNCLDWQWWFFFVPLTVFVSIRSHNEK